MYKYKNYLLNTLITGTPCSEMVCLLTPLTMCAFIKIYMKYTYK